MYIYTLYTYTYVKENMYIYMYTIVNMYIYICICICIHMFMYIYIYIYIYKFECNFICIHIYTTQPTPKFAKHARCEQVGRHVNIPTPHPNPEKTGGSLPVAWGRRLGSNITMENHHFSWVNQQTKLSSIANC